MRRLSLLTLTLVAAGRADAKPETFSQTPEPPPANGCRAGTDMLTENQPPPLSRPASPWSAVKGDQPLPMPTREPDARAAMVRARENVTACDAAHDHCLRDCTWLVGWEVIVGERQDPQAPMQRLVAAAMRPDHNFVSAPTASGPVYRFNSYANEEDGYTAYRSVPAVKRLLRPGVRVAVPDFFQDNPPVVPASEVDALGPWRSGVLRSVDYDKGVLYIKRSSRPWPLAAARVLVLRYPKGGAVELMEGFTRDEINVSPDELLLAPPAGEP